jgi:hypothetical protein
MNRSTHSSSRSAAIVIFESLTYIACVELSSLAVDHHPHKCTSTKENQCATKTQRLALCFPTPFFRLHLSVSPSHAPFLSFFLISLDFPERGYFLTMATHLFNLVHRRFCHSFTPIRCSRCRFRAARFYLYINT